MRRRPAAIIAIVAAALVGCTGSAPAPDPTASPEATAPSPTRPTPTRLPASWSTDLEQLDELVRSSHPSPWEIHSEAEWEAALARVAAALATVATQNEQMVQVSELVGLLDSHSAFVDIPGSWHFYELLPYRFSDGWFVVRAADAALVGAELVSIAGVPIEDVIGRSTPLVPHDNANGLLMGLLWLVNNVEYLNGAGIVADPAHPSFELRRPDGSTVVVDPPVVAVDDYDLVNPGWLNGPAPEAVARRPEQIWTRIDEAHSAFLIAVNEYGPMEVAARAMADALDAGTVDRVVLDMRYLPGGNGDIAILDALTGEPRVNRDGGLTVLTGRENVSVATQVVYYFDQSHALLVGEATPARASNFTCPCRDETLRHSGFVVSVPTYWDYPGDPRSEITPDIPMSLSSVDFFAGRDPVLEAALGGMLSAP